VALRGAVLAGGAYSGLPEEVKGLFPDSFLFSEELGRWVPEGWEVTTIQKRCKLNSQSWTTKKHPDIVEYIDLSSVNEGVIDIPATYSFDDAPSRARRVLKKHDTVIGLVRPGNKAYAYIDKDGLTGSTGFAVIRSLNSNTRAFIYLLLTQDSSTEYFAHVADGGAYPAIRPDVVGDLVGTFPSTEALDFFEEKVSSHFEKISTNNNQIQTLTRLRDVLLPELISGRLGV
jgi:type I restriction enzyme S subunit